MVDEEVRRRESEVGGAYAWKAEFMKRSANLLLFAFGSHADFHCQKLSSRKQPCGGSQEKELSSKAFEDSAHLCSNDFNQKYGICPNFVQNVRKESLWLEEWLNARHLEGKSAHFNSAKKDFPGGSSSNKAAYSSGKLLSGIEDDGFIGSSIHLSMLSKLERLDEVLQDVESFLNQGVQLPTQAFYLLLKECIRKKDKEAGKKVQTLIGKSGLETNTFLANHLIRLFSSCGTLLDTQEIFCKLPKKDHHVWTSIISAYSKHGKGHEAIKLYHKMRDLICKPDVHTYVAVLNACANTKSLAQGCLVHSHILQDGLDLDLHIGNSLINMYSKCKSLVDAQNMFHKMPIKDAITWNTIIAGCAQNGDGIGALRLYSKMQDQGLKPDRVTFISTLKACGRLSALDQGKVIHGQIIASGLESNSFLVSTLIDMYGKCGALEEAHKVFYKSHKASLVSWNALIAGCVQHGHVQEAFHLFNRMQKDGLKPDKVTFLHILKACRSRHCLDDGQRIHAMLKESALDSDIFVRSALIDMYGKCGSMREAWEVFNKMHGTDTILWNTMIEVFSEHGDGRNALDLFQRMQLEGLEPDKLTFVSVLKACGRAEDLTQGKQVHKQVICANLTSDMYIKNTLIDMYGRCGSLDEACHIFDQSEERDIVSYNAMIAGFVKHGRNQDALKLFESLRLSGLHPNTSTFVNIFKVYGRMLDLKQGKLLHAQLSQSGLDLDLFVGSAIIDMYAKCGSLDEALKMFVKLSEKDVVAWTAMISGYANHGEGQEAFNFYKQMKQECLKPSIVTYLSVLKACGSILDLNQGKAIHAELLEKGLQNDLFVGSALIDMYVKCGSLEEAREVFLRLPQRDTVLWNSMVAGYARHGQGDSALELFKEMQDQGVKPDDVTFLCILSACNHAGMLTEGYQILEQMCRSLGVAPVMEHYACMVDILCRAENYSQAPLIVTCL